MIYEIEHVSQLYKKGKVKANEDISLTIHEGEILGILGPNGAGKSTLIKQMIGHLKPTEGNIRFRGVDVFKQTRNVAEQVAYYSQEPHVLNAMTAYEAMVFTGRLRGMSKADAGKQANELLSMMELMDIKNKQMKHCSGGQRRMIGLGTVLIGDLPVLILDEPTNELDPKNRRMVWNLIQERNSQGATVILVTHNVLEAEQVVDRIAVVNHGKLLAVDTVSKLKQKVDHEDLPIEEYAVKPPSLEDVYFHIDEQVDKEVRSA